jgi:hypothetical protein
MCEKKHSKSFGFFVVISPPLLYKYMSDDDQSQEIEENCQLLLMHTKAGISKKGI